MESKVAVATKMNNNHHNAIVPKYNEEIITCISRDIRSTIWKELDDYLEAS